MNSNETIDVDLPSLQSIQLGIYALQGWPNSESCSLLMRSINEIIRMIACRSSKSTIYQF